MPSNPNLQACWKTVAPSSSARSLKMMPADKQTSHFPAQIARQWGLSRIGRQAKNCKVGRNRG
jgi:hypothetical protein